MALAPTCTDLTWWQAFVSAGSILLFLRPFVLQQIFVASALVSRNHSPSTFFLLFLAGSCRYIDDTGSFFVPICSAPASSLQMQGPNLHFRNTIHIALYHYQPAYRPPHCRASTLSPLLLSQLSEIYLLLAHWDPEFDFSSPAAPPLVALASRTPASFAPNQPRFILNVRATIHEIADISTTIEPLK